MDVVKALQNYVNRMVTDVAGLKVLLMDSETTPFVSVVLTQSQLLSQEVYLMNRIDQRGREKMKHMKCVCFLRPTSESIQALVEELRDPAYGEYHLFFSNILKKSQIERLAEVDDFEVVKEVQEFYGDFMAFNSDLFTLNLCSPRHPIYGDAPNVWDGYAFQRSVEGLISVMLALKKRPVIRYAQNSPMAKRLATEMQYQMQQESQLFDFRRPDTAPLLLIMDRKNDPVTPLLSQWTYQAMVHELLGISNGRVDMSGLVDKSEIREIVLSADQDPFYRKNMFLNLGDLGANIKEYVEQYQSKTQSNMKIDSIAEMKRFVEEYPEFKKLSGNVSKHVALVGELSKIVARQHLLETGELEQSLACVEQHSNDLKSLQTFIDNPQVPLESKVKLVCLYGLRYEKAPANSMNRLLEQLRRNNVPQEKCDFIKNILRYGGASQRLDDIFSNESILSKGKSVFRGLQGVENIYTQHVPYMQDILEQLSKNKLRELQYPFLEGGGLRDRPQDIIVFVVGGATYAEAKSVAQFNASAQGMRIVLGGTHIHNSCSFLDDISKQ
eukprot:Partr_v1_DN26412_c0_g1_i2_m23909 putative Vacuolar protein sorting-associated protein